MRQAFTTARRWMYTHPLPRTGGFVISNIIGGILIAWFVLELSKSGAFILKEAFKTEVSLYILIYVVIVYLWFRGLYRFERNPERWNDPKFLESQMTEQLWPYMIKAWRKRIQDGDAMNLEEIKQDMLK